jgi:hypothetical protein
MRRTMTLGTKWRSRAGRATLVALLAGLSIAGLLGARSASAGWHSVASSVHGGARLRITSKPLFGLYPGATRELTLTVHNPDRHRSVVVYRFRVRNTATSRRGCAASRRNLAIRQYAGRPFVVRPRGTRRIVVRLTMPNTVANACQRAVFRLRYSTRVVTRGRNQ